MMWGSSEGNGAVRSHGISALPPTTPITWRVATKNKKYQLLKYRWRSLGNFIGLILQLDLKQIGVSMGKDSMVSNLR